MIAGMSVWALTDGRLEPATEETMMKTLLSALALIAACAPLPSPGGRPMRQLQRRG